MPSFIETQFPIARLSAESYMKGKARRASRADKPFIKERKAFRPGFAASCSATPKCCNGPKCDQLFTQ